MAMQVQVYTAESQLDATLYLSPPAPPLFERHQQLCSSGSVHLPWDVPADGHR